MKNSNDLPRSSRLGIAAVGAFLLAVVTLAAWYFYSSGYLLYYGDAQAHLNISRSLVDSRTPGYDQIGTVWLPVLHLICLPFVLKNFWWTSGLAGTIPVAACFVVAGVCLYSSAQLVYGSATAAWVVLLCFALNPNVLYLATITMTEIVFAAGLGMCLLALLMFRETQNIRYMGLAICASWWMSMTRYDGWFLIPFIALLLTFVARKDKLRVMFVTAAIASLAPMYWMAHNWWRVGNALDFYNGPHSAGAIQGNQAYPGFHNWWQAIRYYAEASRLCCGYELIAVGVLGCAIALRQGKWLGLMFFSMTPFFYTWSVHSSKTPIYAPSIWPHSYYNNRYGIAVVLLMAFAAGSLVAELPKRFRQFGLLVPFLALLPWLVSPRSEQWVIWQESRVNSNSRRRWTAEAATYLESRFRTGDGALTEFGDLMGILANAGIPLKEALYEENGPQWFANSLPSGLVRQMKWAVVQQGDKLYQQIEKAGSFRVVKTIDGGSDPVLLIYERRHAGGLP